MLSCNQLLLSILTKKKLWKETKSTKTCDTRKSKTKIIKMIAVCPRQSIRNILKRKKNCDKLT